jgi:lysophospholipase L1-like esterase
MLSRTGGASWVALGLVLGVLAGVCRPAPADDKKADKEKENTAVKPAVKDEGRHKGFVEIAKKGNLDVVFFGDSITDGWRGNGKDVWKERFEPVKAVNFGIGGDRTQHVLWRIQNGELDGCKPKAAVLMIGTNNLGSNTAKQIAEGIKAIVEEIEKKQPDTKVLLLGIFPRGEKADDPARDKIKEINKIVAKLDDGKKVRYLDIGDKFLEKDGSLPKTIMYDYLHLTPAGYKIWAETIEKPLGEMLK